MENSCLTDPNGMITMKAMDFYDLIDTVSKRSAQETVKAITASPFYVEGAIPCGTASPALCGDGKSDESRSQNLENPISDITDISTKGQKDMADYTLSEYIDYWMETFKVNRVEESTLDRLLTSINTMRKYNIAQMEIKSITTLEIIEYMNELVEHGYALTTVKKLVNIVTAPLSQAAALHHIPCDPTVGVRFPKEEYILKQRKEAIPYTPEEQEKLWAVLDTKKRWGYRVIGFMLETGTRIGEALALEWSDIDFNRKSAKIRKTVARLANKKQSKIKKGAKTHSSNRIIPLTPKAMEILEELYSTSPNEWVFSDDEGERLSYEAVRYQTQCACKEAGIEYRGEHVFRHTYATNHYKNKTNIKILSKVLGHSSVSITQDIYVHLYGDGFDEMYAELVKNAQ